MIRMPSRSRRARTSADCASARFLTRLLTKGRSTGAACRSTCTPSSCATAQLDADAGGGDERLRRHAVVEDARTAHAVALDDGDVRPVLDRDEGRLVTGRATAHDHNSGHARPSSWLPCGCVITVRPLTATGRPRWAAAPPVARSCLWNPFRSALPCTGAAVCRLRVEHGSGADEGACPALADGGYGLAHGLAADVRRRGLRVGRRAVHRRRRPSLAGLRGAVRRPGPRRRAARPLGRRRAGAAQEAAAAREHAGRRHAGLDLRARRLRRRPAVGPLPRRARGRGRTGGRPRGLRRRTAQPPEQQVLRSGRHPATLRG